MKIDLKKNNNVNKLKFNKPKFFFYSLLVLVFFVLCIWSERYDARLYLQKSFKEFLEFSSTKIFSNFNDIDKITIDIKYKNYQKIMKSREKAIEYGRLKDEFVDCVLAKIQFNDTQTDIKLKLNGCLENSSENPSKYRSNAKKLRDELSKTTN